jgi:hypothetical protein
MALKIKGDIEMFFMQSLVKIPYRCYRPFALKFDDTVNLRMKTDQGRTFGLNQPCDAAFRQVGFDVGNQAQAPGDIPQGSH